MANIFLSFFNPFSSNENPKGMPLFYEGFVKGLREAGNDVLCYFSQNWYSEKLLPPPNELINKIKNFHPHLIVLFNNNFYNYDFSKEFSCPVVIYEVDSFRYFSNKENIYNNPDFYHYVVCSSDSVNFIKKELNINDNKIMHIPFFTSIHSEEKEKTKNICFIGSFFRYSDFVERFMSTNPNISEVKKVKGLLSFFKENPKYSLSDYLIKNDMNHSKIMSFIKKKDDILSMISSVKRIKVLSCIADLGLDLYGTKDWVSQLNYYPELALSFKSNQVYSIRHNQDVYNASKIGLSISHVQATNGFPWRVLDIMASNACLVSDPHADFAKLFPKVSIPVYHSAFEARELCLRLLKDEAMRLDIVAQCQDTAKNYRFNNVLTKIESFLGIDLKYSDPKTFGNFSILSDNSDKLLQNTLEPISNSRSTHALNSLDKIKSIKQTIKNKFLSFYPVKRIKDQINKINRIVHITNQNLYILKQIYELLSNNGYMLSRLLNDNLHIKNVNKNSYKCINVNDSKEISELVSIIIPAFNHSQFIKDAIQSAIIQTYNKIELIIIDDGSSDDTWDKILRLKAACEDRFKRVIFKSQSNCGRSETLNKLLDYAQGEYILLLASDDILKSKAVATLFTFLSEHPDYILAVGDNEFIDEQSRRVYLNENFFISDQSKSTFSTFGQYLGINSNSENSFGKYTDLIYHNNVPNGYLIRKKSIYAAGKYDPYFSLEDYYMNLQLAKLGKMKFINKILYSYRKHFSNSIKNESSCMYEYYSKIYAHEKDFCLKHGLLSVWQEAKESTLNHFLL